jgi:O-methyltransferase
MILSQQSLSPELIQALADYTLCTPNRLNNLWRLAQYMDIHQVEGDIVECGTYKGGTAAALASTMADNQRHLWLYDSFAGMPETTEKDGVEASHWVGSCVAAQADVEAALALVGLPRDRYTLRPGWFSQTFQQPLPDKIALLHCDADWYASVTEVLETLYDRISEGGCIVFDDFGFWEGCREAVFDFCRQRRIAPLLERVGPDQAFWIKGRTHNRGLDHTWVQEFIQAKHPNDQSPSPLEPPRRLSMMAKSEQTYITDYCQNRFENQGKIVELGCWLGSATLSMAQGLVAAGRTPTALIHAYDIFIWDNSMTPFLGGQPLSPPLETGDSFLPQYLMEIESCKEWVQVHAGDLCQEIWSGEPIEFLFVDAMKSWELSQHIVRQFFTALIPGKSIVFHQDFAYFGTYWIPILMYRLRDYFQPVEDITDAWGVAFQLTQALPIDRLGSFLTPGVESLAELDQMIEYCKSFTHEKKWPQFYGAKVMALMSLDRSDLAELTLMGHHLTPTDLQMPLGIDFPRTLLYLTQHRQRQQNAELDRIKGELIETKLEIDRLNQALETRQPQASTIDKVLKKIKRKLTS